VQDLEEICKCNNYHEQDNKTEEKKKKIHMTIGIEHLAYSFDTMKENIKL
jgi:hypothetical protein